MKTNKFARSILGAVAVPWASWLIMGVATLAIINVASGSSSVNVTAAIGLYLNVGGPPFYTFSFAGVTEQSYANVTYLYGYNCPNNWYAPAFNVSLQPGVNYQCTVKTPSEDAGQFCDEYGIPQPVGFTVVDACSTTDVYINGVNTTSYEHDINNLNDTFNVMVMPQTILFQWDYPQDGVQALTADGQSTISGTATNGSANIVWSFDGPNLGCQLLLATGPTVIVQAGTNTGTINVTATDPVGGTCTTQPLNLVDCNGGCAACQTGGGLSVGNNCVEMRLNLGWALEGNTADYLHIKEYVPSSALATPQALHYDFQHSDVQVYSNAFGICQVKAPQMLANIVTNSSSQYSIQLYNPTNIIGIDASGCYAVANSPYRTITVENPGGNTNEVLFTDSNDGATYDFTWHTNGWLLSSGGGLRNELKTTVITNNLSIVTTTVSTGSSPPAQTKVETWQGISTNGLRLMQEVFGSGSAARTNFYSYYTNGFLQQLVRWDGSWAYYLYDAYYRPTNVFSGFLNQGVTTNPALCRLTVYDYSSNSVSGSGDAGLLYFDTPRCTTEYVQGTEVSRKYFVGLPGQRREIQCVLPGAAWNDTNNLVTTYNLFTGGFRGNEPWEIIHPDGTAEIYQYANVEGTTATNFVWSGHLDGTGTNIDDGTETISVIGPTGLQLSKTVMDIQSGITTAQELYAYDSLNRLTTTTYLDGTYVQNTYDCCTIETQQDRDGTVTSYTHDALKRLLTTTLNGITTSNVYDPAGNILGVVRFGSDASAITNSQATYDDGGQQTSAADALNNTTIYTNYFDGSGQLVRQTIYPDTSTRIETYYQDGSLQSVTGTAVYTVRYEYGVDSDSGVQHAYTKTIQLDGSGNDTGNWTKNYSDDADRTYKTVYADNNYSQSTFNNQGQLASQTDPDGVTTLYQYDGRGRLLYTATDMNTNGVIDFTGTDRIAETVNNVTADNGVNVNRTRTFVWAVDSSNISNLVSTTETSVDGLQAWNIVFNNGTGVTNHSVTSFDPVHGYRIVTVVAPDGSATVTTNQYSRVISTTRKDANGSQIGQTTYGYDTQGRQNTMTDARNGTATTYFNNADQIVGTLTPSPDGVQSGQLTTNVLDSMGRAIITTLPDSTSVTNLYYPTGLREETYGSRTYPVLYTYDAQWRMKTMTTWTNFASNTGAAVTTWNYDGYRGFLTNKAYADGNGPLYAYTPAGRLQTRIWARGITTTYAYDNAGGLSVVSYSDSTAGVGYGYNRLGRQITITNGVTVCTRTYNDAGELMGESYSGGPLDGLSVTNGYDALLRRTNLNALSAGSQLLSSAYGYDAASRLQTVSSGTNSASYGYVANSPLVSQIAFTNGAALRMTTTKQYDYLNRLTQIQSSAGGLPVASFNYDYNSANQRTAATNVDNSYWVYQYDSLGQVISGKKYWSDGTPVAGQQFTYGFDDIGNRKTAASGGDSTGSNLRSAGYTANNLNQYTSRDMPGYLDVLGSANSNSTVTVNLQRAYRHGGYFQDELSANNTSAALWFSLTNLAVLNNGTNADIITTNTGNVFLAQTPESFSYDADGDLTNDGRFAYTWDAENRLLDLTSVGSAPSGSRVKLDFAYDYQGRRAQEIVSAWNGSAYIAQSTNRFVYDSWNLVGVLDGNNNLLDSFQWGTDLSGTMQGAGGVGGLISMTVYSGTNAGTYFYSYDGNGNVAALVKAADGTASASYEYDPFGQVIRATGLMAEANPFRFSTKYQDDETGLNYYGYRFYNPSHGRWPNRDPLGEQGGMNLYEFVGNNPISRMDRLGLVVVDIGVEVFIEGDKISFQGEIFNGGTKIRHTVHADTDSETLTEDKYVGPTIEYDQNGNIIARGHASDSGLHASMICTKVKSQSGCPCKFCYIAVSGHAVNPLATPPLGLPHWVVPGIDYDINAEVTACPQSVTIHYTGDHDRFPSYKFTILGDLVHSYSQTSPWGLFPVAQVHFDGTINIMTQ